MLKTFSSVYAVAVLVVHLPLQHLTAEASPAPELLKQIGTGETYRSSPRAFIECGENTFFFASPEIFDKESLNTLYRIAPDLEVVEVNAALLVHRPSLPRRCPLWWIICDYNDIFFPLELEVGTVLRIPSVEHMQMRLLI